MLHTDPNLPTWITPALLLFLGFWLAVQILVGLLLSIILFRGYSLLWKIEEASKHAALDKLEALEDRKITRELLITLKGWAVVMEKKDESKERKIAKVAEDAAQNAQAIKDVIVTTVANATEPIADKVLEKIRSGTDSKHD